MQQGSQPKRHHWWPQAQSRFWVDANGNVTVTKQDGTAFLAKPINIGVESELYTRFDEDGNKDASLEDWFANAIDAPARALIEHLLDPSNTSRRPFRGKPEAAAFAASVGFRTNPYIDFIHLPRSVHEALAHYVAALVVRHPDYLRSLAPDPAEAEQAARRNVSLDVMLDLFEKFSKRILHSNSLIMMLRRIEDDQFYFADSGVSTIERWETSPIPFRLQAPITPDVTLSITPLPFGHQFKSQIAIAESTNLAVARANRVIVGAAKRFVFSRGPSDTQFIRRHFGIAPPNDLASRTNAGKFEARWATPEEIARATTPISPSRPRS